MILRNFFKYLLLSAVLYSILDYAVVAVHGTKAQCDQFFERTSLTEQLLFFGWSNACLDKGSFPKYK